MKCIICGEEKEESVEHIIPEALGNKTLTTNRVCKSCNNRLGNNVDNYLVDHPLAKIIRINGGLKANNGKAIKFFDGVETDVNFGTKFSMKNGRPKIVPRIITDKNGKFKIEAATIEEGLQHFKKILKRKGFTEEQIESFCEGAYCEESDRHPHILEFHKDASINFALMDLAAIKIAYEYACMIFGDEYFNDKVAQLFRHELYKAISFDKHDVEPDDELAKYVAFPISGSGVDELLDEQRGLLNSESMKVRHTIFFIKQDNCLYCILNLCMTDVITFAVKVTEDTDRYNLERLPLSIVFEDGTAVTF